MDEPGHQRTGSSSLLLKSCHFCFYRPYLRVVRALLIPSQLGQSSPHNVLLTLGADSTRSDPLSLHIQMVCWNTAPVLFSFWFSLSPLLRATFNLFLLSVFHSCIIPLFSLPGGWRKSLFSHLCAVYIDCCGQFKPVGALILLVTAIIKSLVFLDKRLHLHHSLLILFWKGLINFCNWIILYYSPVLLHSVEQCFSTTITTLACFSVQSVCVCAHKYWDELCCAWYRPQSI